MSRRAEWWIDHPTSGVGSGGIRHLRISTSSEGLRDRLRLRASSKNSISRLLTSSHLFICLLVLMNGPLSHAEQNLGLSIEDVGLRQMGDRS